MTVVGVVAVLFAVFGSGVAAETVAVLVMTVPSGVDGFTSTVNTTRTNWPGSRSFRSHDR